MKHTVGIITAFSICLAPVAALAGITASPAPGDAGRGEQLWKQESRTAGKPRSCVTCHTSDPRKGGRHARTGKPIKPMAPSVNPERLSDPKKMAKWFKRNCKWTLGRVCSDQEKADIISYLKSL